MILEIILLQEVQEIKCHINSWRLKYKITKYTYYPHM